MAKKIKVILSRSVSARKARYQQYRDEIEELELAGTARTEAIMEIIRRHKTSTATVYKALSNVL